MRVGKDCGLVRIESIKKSSDMKRSKLIREEIYISVRSWKELAHGLMKGGPSALQWAVLTALYDSI